MRGIGLAVKPPRTTCQDEYCPFHGTLRVRGRIFEGKAASVKARNTVVVEREYLHYVPKYLRYEKRRSKIHAHLPPCLPVKEGDTIMIAECRPLAKTVAFVVVQQGHA